MAFGLERLRHCISLGRNVRMLIIIVISLSVLLALKVKNGKYELEKYY
jgi:hypothetical protein